MFMNDLVSIITPSYNTAEFISETIQSVLSQTYTNWEMIIVDDCSSDNTDEVVAPFLADSRIKYIKNDANSGAAVSRNRALREANGRWIAFLDSDDLWHPQKLEKQISFMESNGYSFSYTNYTHIDEFSHFRKVNVSGPKRITKAGMYNYCWPGCLTVMYDADVIGLVQIKDIKKRNDYAIWLQVCHKATCYKLDEYLAQYRVRKNSISRSKLPVLLKHQYRLYNIALEMNPVMSLFSTARNMIFGVYKKKFYVSRTEAMYEAIPKELESVHNEKITVN